LPLLLEEPSAVLFEIAGPAALRTFLAILVRKLQAGQGKRFPIGVSEQITQDKKSEVASGVE